MLRPLLILLLPLAALYDRLRERWLLWLMADLSDSHPELRKPLQWEDSQD